MLFRFVGTILSLTMVVALAGCEQRPVDETPTMAEFVALVRGHDAATIRRTFPAYNSGLFLRTYGPGPSIPLGGTRERAIFAEQVVRTPAGALIDVGHVIAGIEAGGPLPLSAQLVERFTGCELRAAVTWAGDLGEAIAEYLVAGGGVEESGVDVATYYDRSSPPEDLLGNIDGYVLGASLLPDADVAALLTATYLDGGLERVRFRRFVALFGDELEAAVSREAICFARALIQLGGVSGPADPALVDAVAPPFIERFLAYVRANVADEAALSP